MSITSERYHCEIGRIRFKHHRDRLPRKDKRAIERAFRATTAKLKAEAARQAQIAQRGRQG